MPTVLTGDYNAMVQIWPTALEGLLAQAARRVGRRLDPALLREIGVFGDQSLFNYHDYPNTKIDDRR
jgi:hypothetical protein